MSQFPNPPQSYPQPATQLDRPRTSAAAVTSLILGILGCVPLITSILAVILGIVGIRATGRPNVGGRGLAIAGLILGLIGVIGWATMGGGVYAFYVTSRPVANVAQQFTKDLAAGNITAAQAQCEPTVTTDELTKLSDQFKQWGTFQDLTLPARHVDAKAGQSVWKLDGIARFGSDTKSATIELRAQPDGSYKVTSAEFR